MADYENLMEPVESERDEKALFQTKRRKNVKFDFKLVKIISRLVAAGMSQKDVAYVLGVREETLCRWKQKYSLLRRAIDEGKSMAVAGLIHSGLRAATGYEYEEETLTLEKDAENQWKEIKKVIHKKKYPPNASLIMFLLTNLDPENFSKRLEVNSQKVSVNVNPETVKEGIKKLAGKLAEISGTNVIDTEFTDESNESI